MECQRIKFQSSKIFKKHGIIRQQKKERYTPRRSKHEYISKQMLGGAYLREIYEPNDLEGNERHLRQVNYIIWIFLQ